MDMVATALEVIPDTDLGWDLTRASDINEAINLLREVLEDEELGEGGQE